ncbi:mitochondrial carrier [Penicillium paradoxum]|uniref:mitochondrial carrier n=1 Tax=Penicillium paradoxum TaxID=176176 RepID=UPI0025470C58|nr:mitochondrial carrier [Penicillium paradoxum]KAJ5794806.1 mitochondrial carrier [Penicillium paradoxum]
MTGTAQQSTNNADQPDPTDKQNWNYALRSGLAGGIAGCAVSMTKASPKEQTLISKPRQKQSLRQ